MGRVQDDEQPELTGRIAGLDLGEAVKLSCRLDDGPRGEPSEVGDTIHMTILASHAGEIADLATDQTGTLTWGRVDGPYRAEVSVAHVDTEMNRLELTLESEPKRVQRREFFRVTASLEVIVTAAEETAHAVTVDLSESGTRLALRGRTLGSLYDEKRVQLTLMMPDREILTEAEVVRVIINNEGGAEMSLHFVRMGSNDRDRIRAYLFERQRQMRKFGLI